VLICATACEALRDDPATTQQRGMGSSTLPPPTVTGPRIAEVDIPTEPPFVGREGVDAHGYPYRVPDQVALLQLLRLGRFDELDRFMTFYQDEFEADWHKEEWPDTALLAFYSADTEIASRLEQWVAAKPDSFAAWAARGNHHHKVAWHYRGDRFIKDTTPEQIKGMRDAAELARADFEKALQLRPKYLAAQDRLIQLANIVGDDEAERRHFEASAVTCPTCFLPHETYLHALETRWGGSPAALLAHAEQAAKQADQNPRLTTLLGYAALDRCISGRLDKQWAAAHTACDEALGHGNETSYLLEKAQILVTEEKYAEARPFIDRARDRSPQNRSLLRLGYISQSKDGDILKSARDLIVLRHLDPSAENVAKYVEYMVGKLRFDGQELNKAGKYVEAADYFALGLQLAPDDADMMQREALNQKSMGMEDVERQLAAAPDDFALHLRVDHGLAASGRFADVVAIWDRFIARHPTDPRPYVERAGAKWHRGLKEEAIADMQEACRLGMSKACGEVPKMKERLRKGPGRG
jgi:tetratricopeptide (TPR) repeat protein